jgi:hypothetical protein
MIVTPSVPGWNKDAAYILKRFLDTAVGKLFLIQLSARRPRFYPGIDLAGAGLNGKYVAGYEAAINQIMYLMEPPDVPTSGVESHYPDLDDDSQWVDKPEEPRAMPPLRTAVPKNPAATSQPPVTTAATVQTKPPTN